ncbi:rCG51597 [Rattus norvegicus]|uniref:RCG51597 n=1 Tax=Rattus norvegicus TaxID=10116 RepID=A6IYI0_RAT|nr:rCG51597 [Rattus norvegicus]
MKESFYSIYFCRFAFFYNRYLWIIYKFIFRRPNELHSEQTIIVSKLIKICYLKFCLHCWL